MTFQNATDCTRPRILREREIKCIHEMNVKSKSSLLSMTKGAKHLFPRETFQNQKELEYPNTFPEQKMAIPRE